MISNYQEKVTVTKVKKFYATMSNAFELAIIENGDVESWNLPLTSEGGSQELYQYIKPYLKIAKECVEDNSNNCIADPSTQKYKYLNGVVLDTATDYVGSNYVRFVLSDSSVAWIRSTKPGSGEICNDSGDVFNCGQINYDVNGPAGPNQFGKDIFFFYIMANGISPKKLRYEVPNSSCYLNDEGWDCVKWVLEKGNMDYPATK